MATKTWTGTQSNFWDVAGNWSGGSLPNSLSVVTIGVASSSPYQIIIDSNDRIRSLTVSGTGTAPVTLDDQQTLTVLTNTIMQKATLNVDSGASATLIGSVSLSGNSSIAVDAGSLYAGAVSGIGTISLAGGASVEIGNTASGNIAFLDGSADQLLLDNSSVSLAATITGFVGSDTIDIGSLAYDSSYTSVWSSGELDIKDSTNATVFTISSINNSSGDPGAFQLVNDGSGGTEIVTCYVAGTRILTDRGEVAVEDLREGDGVAVRSGNTTEIRPVRWIGHRQINIQTHPKPDSVLPVRIAKDAFAAGVPHRDLLVSPDHALLVDDVLVAARQLVNGTTLRRETGRRSVHYFHIELETHGILLAEGLPAESYLDTGNRGFFANSSAPLVLHPDLTTEGRACDSRANGACAPFVVDEATVRPIWQRLADRAAALNCQAAPIETTNEPDLRVFVNGQTVKSLYGQDGVYIFPMPAGASMVRLASRAAAPADSAPWLDDRRALGVSVVRLVLRSQTEALDIPVDHPGLADGWWPVERSDKAMHRWTNGNALLRLPKNHGSAMLEVYTNGCMNYPVTAEVAAAPEAKVA
jgi:hypothetical protein